MIDTNNSSTKKTIGGISLISIAIILGITNMSDSINDLKEWHDATTPQFVASILKQIGVIVTGVSGGILLPQIRLNKRTRDYDNHE